MKKHYLFDWAAYLVLIFTLSSCTSSEKNYSQKIKEKNIILVLDLGPRTFSSGQTDRDSESINFIYALFKSHVKKNYALESIINFNVLNYTDQGVNSIIKNLSFNASQNSKAEISQAFENRINEINISQNIINLYSKSPSVKNSEMDIWNFFNSNSEQLLKSTEKYDNYFIIISDGYLLSDRYSIVLNDLRSQSNYQTSSDIIKPIKDKFLNEESKVLYMEITPNKGFDYEYALIENSWNKWFNNMGIMDIQYLKTSDNQNLIEDKISEFLGNVAPVVKITKKKIDYINGTYVGPIIDNKPHGYGKFTTNKKHRFYKNHGTHFTLDGEWKNGLKEGSFNLRVDGKIYGGKCTNDRGFVTLENDTIYLDFIDG